MCERDSIGKHSGCQHLNSSAHPVLVNIDVSLGSAKTQLELSMEVKGLRRVHLFLIWKEANGNTLLMPEIRDEWAKMH